MGCVWTHSPSQCAHSPSKAAILRSNLKNMLISSFSSISSFSLTISQNSISHVKKKILIHHYFEVISFESRVREKKGMHKMLVAFYNALESRRTFQFYVPSIFTNSNFRIRHNNNKIAKQIAFLQKN